MDNIDAGFVTGLWQWGIRQQQEKGLRSFIREIRQMYDMRRPVTIPKEYRKIAQEVRTGQTLLRDISLRITASLTKEPPVYQVEARDDTDDARRAAAIGGKWLSKQLDDMSKLMREDQIHLSALNLVLDSESVMKAVHRPDAWANFPERDPLEEPKKYSARSDKYAKGGVKDPFAWRTVDRLQMIFGDGEYGDDWCLEWGEYPVPYLMKEMIRNPDKPTPETVLGGPPVPEDYATVGPTGKKLEYFNSTTWAVVINGKMAPGFPKENPYAPMLPYMRAVAPPAMYPLKYLAPALDSLETMQLNWAYLTAFPVVVIEALAGVQSMLGELPAGDTGEPPDNTRVWHPGEGWFPPPGYSMKFLEPPAAGRELHAMKADVREMIDVVGVPSVFRGQGGSRQAGYSINQLMAASQMTYKKLVEALERQQENVARFLFNCVEHTTTTTIYVLASDGDERKWLGLKPTGKVQQQVAPVDLLGPPDVHFRPVLPTDEQAMIQLATQALNAPHRPLSHRYMLENMLQIEDPDGMIDEIAAEQQLEQSPDLQMDIEMEARRRAGLPPPGGPPPAPPQAPQQPNDALNQGEATVPGLTQPVRPGLPLATVNPRTGGRPAGSFPGAPGGPHLTAGNGVP